MRYIVRRKGIIIFFTLFFLITALTYVSNSSVDLDNLKRHPESFRFEKVYSVEVFSKALDVLLYEGMPKEKVDEIFVRNAGAVHAEYEDSGVMYHVYKKSTSSAALACGLVKHEPTWHFKIAFDEGGTLSQFYHERLNKKALYEYSFPCNALLRRTSQGFKG